MVQDHFLEKRVFDPFLTHLWSQNGPFSRHFGIFHGPKHATTGSKRPKNTFWRLFGPFLGHIVELEGTKGPLVTRKSSRTWSVAAVYLRLAVLNPY